MDIIKALDALKKLELKVQDLYAHYHKLFAADKEISGLFFDLSLEEKTHADLIDYQLRTIRKNRLLFRDVEFDMVPLSQMIAKIDSHLYSKEPVSMGDALKLGIELEGDALQHHYRSLLSKSNPEVAELLKNLGTSDQEHIDKRMTFARNRGYVD